MIPSIVSIFLLFLTEGETFCCLKSMIDVSRKYLKANENSENDLKEMRWYFTTEAQEFINLCNTFFQGVSAKDEDFKIILKHFEHIEFQYMNIFQEWTKTLYLMDLPLPVLIFFFF